MPCPAPGEMKHQHSCCQFTQDCSPWLHRGLGSVTSTSCCALVEASLSQENDKIPFVSLLSGTWRKCHPFLCRCQRGAILLSSATTTSQPRISAYLQRETSWEDLVLFSASISNLSLGNVFLLCCQLEISGLIWPAFELSLKIFSNIAFHLEPRNCSFLS